MPAKAQKQQAMEQNINMQKQFKLLSDTKKQIEVFFFLLFHILTHSFLCTPLFSQPRRTPDPLCSSSVPVASSSSPRLAPDMEQARPQTSGEEELQLQLALAMSREESEKVPRTVITHTHADTPTLY